MCKPDTLAPTDAPSKKPTPYPTKKPTPTPTTKATPYPTREPITPYPTDEPTKKPTIRLTTKPTEEPAAAELEEEQPAEEEPEDEEPEEEEPEEEEPEEEEPEEEEPEEEEPTEEKPEEEEPAEEEPEEEEPDEIPEEEEPDEVPEEASSALTIQIKPCKDPLAMTVNQAYWRSWSSDNPDTCNKFDPSDIDGTSYTHIVYSFASISSDGLVEPWVGSWDEVDKYKEFNKVKERNPKVKTIIAVTEGVFYGSGMNPVTYNEVVASETNRMAFAQSAVSFLELYDFDGIEIDWDAPLDTDKGGSPDNYELLVSLAEEIRLAIKKSGKEFIFTIALPPTDWELYDYDVIGLSKHVDWFNLMSFDYHTPKNIPKTVGAHSDLKMIDSVVFELLKETVSTKFVLGMAAFGRTYSLADDRCQELGCPFRSPGLGGCGNTKGFLPFSEIHEYIESRSYDQLHQDVSSSSMVAVVDGDQMISFDDESTWAIKEAYAEMMCLRGTMLWSVDMLKPKPSSQPQQNTVDTGRLLSTFDSQPHGCDICTDTELIDDTIVMYAGNTTTCGDVSALHHLTKASNFKCSLARSLLTSSCCSHAESKTPPAIDPTPSSKPCNVCRRNQIHHELKSEEFVEYKGTSVSCLDLNSILAKNEVQDSEMCSDTQAVLFDDCCYEKCTLCGDKSLRYDATVKYNKQILSCSELGPLLTLGMVRDGSDQCNAIQSAYSNTCCFSPPKKRCSLCEHGSISLEINSHSFIKTRSSSIHCMNLADGLAEREEDGSPVCEESKLDYSTTCCVASNSHKPGSDASYYDWLADHLKKTSQNAASIATISICPLIMITLLLAFKQ
jgi:chitinase